MARSASDATRFTATTPTASSKPIAPSTTIKNLGRGAIPGETPQQKIFRLRAAAAAARAGKESQFDKVVRVGRRWADRAHRATAYSLIGLTVASGVIAAFAIGDMLMHNRRKRSEWLIDQQTKHRALIDEAKAQLSRGEHITEDQMLLINQEAVTLQAAELQKNKPGIMSRVKSAVFSSVPDEETKGGELAKGVAEQAKEGFKQAEKKIEGLGIREAVEDKVEQARRVAEQGKQKVESGVEEVERRAGNVLQNPAIIKVVGGPLDREAQAATDKVKDAGKSWTDWVLRR